MGASRLVTTAKAATTVPSKNTALPPRPHPTASPTVFIHRGWTAAAMAAVEARLNTRHATNHRTRGGMAFLPVLLRPSSLRPRRAGDGGHRRPPGSSPS
jgi:hypothetical protein